MTWIWSEIGTTNSQTSIDAVSSNANTLLPLSRTPVKLCWAPRTQSNSRCSRGHRHHKLLLAALSAFEDGLRTNGYLFGLSVVYCKCWSNDGWWWKSSSWGSPISIHCDRDTEEERGKRLKAGYIRRLIQEIWWMHWNKQQRCIKVMVAKENPY